MASTLALQCGNLYIPNVREWLDEKFGAQAGSATKPSLSTDERRELEAERVAAWEEETETPVGDLKIEMLPAAMRRATGWADTPVNTGFFLVHKIRSEFVPFGRGQSFVTPERAAVEVVDQLGYGNFCDAIDEGYRLEHVMTKEEAEARASAEGVTLEPNNTPRHCTGFVGVEFKHRAGQKTYPYSAWHKKAHIGSYKGRFEAALERALYIKRFAGGR